MFDGFEFEVMVVGGWGVGEGESVKGKSEGKVERREVWEIVVGYIGGEVGRLGKVAEEELAGERGCR